MEKLGRETAGGDIDPGNFSFHSAPRGCGWGGQGTGFCLLLCSPYFEYTPPGVEKSGLRCPELALIPSEGGNM